eukprot:279600_1
MTSNLLPETRVLIVKEGWNLQAQKRIQNNLSLFSSPKIKYSEIKRAIGTNHNEPHDKELSRPSCKHWWDKRKDLELTGKLEHKKRTGRPIHPAFATEEKTEEVIDYCLNEMDIGDHQLDVMEQFEIKSAKTLRKHTKKIISMCYAPKKNAKSTEDTCQLRIDFINRITTPTGQLTRKFAGGTHVDHKKAAFYGNNKRHTMQYKRKGDDKSKMIPYNYELNNPYLMTYFAANKGGVTCYIHANKRLKKRGVGEIVDCWNVDSDDVVQAWEDEFLDFMDSTEQYTGHRLVICDGVSMQHCPAVKDFFEDNEIELFPCARDEHGGYPPWSHPCSILDRDLFGPYQKDLSAAAKLDYPNYNSREYSKLCWLFDNITPIWETDNYVEKAAHAIDVYHDYMQQILDNDGSIKGLRKMS